MISLHTLESESMTLWRGLPAVFVQYLICVCVHREVAEDLLMTNGWNEPEEPLMGSQPCEVKCKIDI